MDDAVEFLKYIYNIVFCFFVGIINYNVFIF